MNYIISDITNHEDGAYVFCEFVVDDDEVPFIKFNFGTADPTTMNYEGLGKILAIATKHTVALYCMTKKHPNLHFTTVLEEDVLFEQYSDDLFDVNEPIDLEFEPVI